MSAAASGERYNTLDAMRGIAALLVPAGHLRQRWDGSAIVGYLAVDLFFVLSGFVIALRYTDRFAGPLTLARFCELRLIRLYPLYALGLLLGLAKLATGFVVHIPPAATVGSLPCAAAFGAAMLPDPCSVELFPLNGPSWSLFFELAINLAFGLWLWRSSLAMLVALIALSAVFLACNTAAPDYLNVGWAWHNAAAGLFRTILSFCAGIMLFRILPRRAPMSSWLALLPITGMAAIIGLAVPAAYRAGFEMVAIVLVLPGLVMIGCLYEAPSRMARRIFDFLGDLAYAIYSIHWPLIALALPIAAYFRAPAWLSIATFLTILVPLAFVAVRLDEIIRGRISTALKLRRSAPVQIA